MVTTLGSQHGFSSSCALCTPQDPPTHADTFITTGLVHAHLAYMLPEQSCVQALDINATVIRPPTDIAGAGRGDSHL